MQLNLARAWRSKTFDELVGQDLAIRLVKNSLYKRQLFPVYLFAGQRGCGKTTLARLFASAINCAALDVFCTQPHKTILPCNSCDSCISMRAGNHPDFYEIDAASHTGVDNIRTLIENASFLPGLGNKKIYLIDEAHMLSKAAFNAFLKVLEEPPASVVFMLATTDPHKIIDTVRSRCFQLFLQPVSVEQLVKHLAYIAQEEKLSYEEKALWLIAYEAEGSVRDALNCLERVRMAYPAITYDSVLTLLGDISYEQVILLCQAIYAEPADAVLTLCTELVLHRFSALCLWKKFVEVTRALVWISSGLEYAPLALHKEQLAVIAHNYSSAFFTQALEILYENEPLFAKTQRPHALLEMLFLKLHGLTQTHKNSKGGAATALSSGSSVKKNIIQGSYSTTSVSNHGKVVAENSLATTGVTPVIPAKAPVESSTASAWASFMQKVQQCDDPLMISVFTQCRFEAELESQVVIVFSEHLSFFKDLLEQTAKQWQPFLEQVFGKNKKLEPRFTDKSATGTSRVVSQVVTQIDTQVAAPVISPQEPSKAPMVSQNSSAYSRQPFSKGAYKQVERPIVVNVRDAQAWPKVHTVLRVFPGIVVEEKSEHEYYT